MQKMAKYFGFRVKIENELDPVRVDCLKEKAAKIVAVHDFNPDEYFVYFHQLSIFPEDEHFGVKGGLTKRLKGIELRFMVNLKQRRNRRIKFLNFLLDLDLCEKIKTTGGCDEMGYYLKGEYFVDNLSYRNEIATFISKDLREDHRKIKVSVTAYPTDEFSCKINNEDKESRTSKFDCKFQKPIVLRSPINANETISQKHQTKEGVLIMEGDTYNIYGQCNSAGRNATSHGATNQQILNNKEDFKRISSELKQILSKLESLSDNNDNDETLEKINRAIQAVDSGDEKSFGSAIKSVGKKVLGISEKIGTTLATEYIKSQMGP